MIQPFLREEMLKFTIPRPEKKQNIHIRQSIGIKIVKGRMDTKLNSEREEPSSDQEALYIAISIVQMPHSHLCLCKW